MKYMRLEIPIQFFINWFNEGNEIHAKIVKNGLPKGTKFCYAYQNNNYILNIVIEHESFKELKVGEEIPIHEPVIFDSLSCQPIIMIENYRK